jgi:N-methylhydantoinase A/oxoprolinase/acetone carboxylase beta subunit
MKRIGIDVGGTNTDAVLVEDDVLLAAVKRPGHGPTASTPS